MQTKTLYRLASLLVVMSLVISANWMAHAASPLAVQTLGAASQVGDDWQPSFPIRAAFYYPWFPQAWTQSGIFPYTNYTPSLGYYSSDDLNIVRRHIEMMQYANIQAGISSWWGQGQHTDTKFAGLLSAAAGINFRWALYYENERSVTKISW